MKGKAKKKQEWESDASDAASAGEDSHGGHDLIKVLARHVRVVGRLKGACQTRVQQCLPYQAV